MRPPGEGGLRFQPAGRARQSRHDQAAIRLALARQIVCPLVQRQADSVQSGHAELPHQPTYILGKSVSGGTGSLKGRSSFGRGSGGFSTGRGVYGCSGGGLLGFGSLPMQAKPD